MFPGTKTDDLTGQQAVKAEVRTIIASRTYEEWTAIFAELDLCVEPVLGIDEMVEHAQTQARQMIVDVPKADGSVQRQIGSPFKFSQSQPIYKHVGAALGQHTQEVLTELGYSDGQVEQLRMAGVFG